MSATAATVTHLFASGIVIADIGIIAALILLVLYAFGKAPAFFDTVIDFFGNYGLLIAFLSALGSLLGSLYYSEIVGFPPCEFCILQRIFMYPQVLILGFALWKKPTAKTMALIAFMFSVVGAGIGLFQYYGQMFDISVLPCAAAAVSCAIREFVEYGYITIPMMSATAFIINILSIGLWHIAKKREARLPMVR